MLTVPNVDKSTWQTIRFGDVALEVKDTEQDPLAKGITRYVGLADLDPDSIQLKRWSEIADGQTTFTRLFRKGQMLFGRRRAYQRKAAVAPFDGICSGDIIVMEAKPDRLLPELLPFLIHTDGFFDYAIQTSAGSLSPRTKWSHLAKYEFALPPLDEQRRIAEVLWSAEMAFRKVQDVAKAAKTVLVRACQEWTSIPNEFAPMNWGKFKLGECADLLDSQRVPISQNNRATMRGDIPYYGANGIIDYINDFIFDEEIVLVGEDGDHFLKYKNWEQSFLVSGKSWVNNHAHVFKAKAGITTNEWLYRFLQHRDISPYLQDSASMTRKKLTQSNLLFIPVQMPMDMKSQQRILSAITVIEESYQQAQEHTEFCKTTVKSLINSLMG
jgi:type I restriction enzyme, S subunit